MVGSARDEAKAEKRRRIVDAAVEVFADKGFFGARVSEIAEVAGVADGTIYLYFKSKDDILISLFREKMTEILHRFAAMLAQTDDPEQKVRRYISEHLALVAEQPKLMQVLTVELRQSAQRLDRRIVDGSVREVEAAQGGEAGQEVEPSPLHPRVGEVEVVNRSEP